MNKPKFKKGDLAYVLKIECANREARLTGLIVKISYMYPQPTKWFSWAGPLGWIYECYSESHPEIHREAHHELELIKICKPPPNFK
jgi:hypothetical protein